MCVACSPRTTRTTTSPARCAHQTLPKRPTHKETGLSAHPKHLDSRNPNPEPTPNPPAGAADTANTARATPLPLHVGGFLLLLRHLTSCVASMSRVVGRARSPGRSWPNQARAPSQGPPHRHTSATRKRDPHSSGRLLTWLWDPADSKQTRFMGHGSP